MHSEEYIQKLTRYREKIQFFFPPIYKSIYTMSAEYFFRSSFLRAIQENTEASFRSIMTEPCKGIYTFEMLEPLFCRLLMAEVDHIVSWTKQYNFKIMRPNIMHQHGVVLHDFGLEDMLNKLMSDFICPITRVFFPEFGGSSLDSHHGFVVEYGSDRDLDLGLHTDDAEVTINICLGKEFFGGDMFFRGVRCEEHASSAFQPAETVDCPNVPGHAIMHAGRHRHGARPITFGNRLNLILWCRSSAFRELKKHETDFSSWCGECRRKKEAEGQSLNLNNCEINANVVL